MINSAMETATVVNLIVMLGIGVCVAGIVVMRQQIAKTERKLAQLRAKKASGANVAT